MGHLAVLLYALLTTYSSAAPTPSQLILHERGTPSAKKLARVNANAIIPLRLGLHQRNLENGYQHLMEVSDPSSPLYGKHWNVDQVQDTYSPSQDSIDNVKSWLVSAGINESSISQSANKGWLGVDLPAWRAEALMKTEYYEYRENHDGTVRIGCEEYYLPQTISQHVDYIRPGVTLSPPLKKHKLNRRDLMHGSPKFAPVLPQFTMTNVTLMPNATASNLPKDLQNCGTSITPQCLRALYSIPRSRSKGSSSNLGVFEAGGAYDQADLDEYYAAFAKHIPSGTQPVLDSINGAQAPTSQSAAQAESVLDIDILISLTYPEPVTLYQVAEPSESFTKEQFVDEITFLTPFLDGIDGAFCTALDRSSGLQCGAYNLTKVVSASYVAPELAYGQRAQRRTCHEIMKLGLQGHTILFASGDFGVSGVPNKATGYNGCVPPNLDTNGPTSGSIFNPGFPGNCPYVLSIGATQLSAGQTVNDTESVMSLPDGSEHFSSSGGFSNYFPTPDYQKSAVSNYLNNHVPNYKSYTYNGQDKFSGKSNIGKNGGVYNRAGRGYPDVSANGAAYTAYIRGQKSQYLGTSLSTPVWASIIALINTERESAGKGAVGFVQPALYQHPEVFHDITSGSNPGCGTNGFPAAPGWDPSTGLGTPHYPALRDLFMSLP